MSDHLPPGQDYTDSDIQLKPLVIFLVATLIVTVAVILGVKVLFNNYGAKAEASHAAMDAIVEANRPTNAVVEGLGEAAVSLQRLRAEEDALLNHYKVGEQGQVQIPVEQAMEKLVAKGLPVRRAVEAAATPADETPVQAGLRVFTQLGCIACHGEVTGALGPSLKGVYGHSVALADGSTVVADEAYIRESILEPLAKVVAGYAPVMPVFKGLITDEQLDQVTAYIKSLAK